ncbi:hypothetical protein L198_08156 [Cryptococcus wingfieldii CBS 7118]|uniref:Uncharacterized protein n=1 Tax=Cryptococcus wingfieldii CBS 7118 TaxID=1295528 RepID=A0A1E3HIS2_9TREE|nr:hypothetical protein L198_08156 [Cryptococcus wingfieldii CBS 7118]ODN75626.1 hypothetical protein L198_08156 [Cryptococcus wingfieldii CBS 7118]
MTSPAPLSTLTDPFSLARLQILVIPVHRPNAPISTSLFDAYLSIIQKHQTLRGDELARPLVSARSRVGSPAVGGQFGGDSNPRMRFFPQLSGGSISASRAAISHQVHLGYTRSPPAKHTYPLSLLRMAGFPLIVLGVSVDAEEEEGYSLGDGDMGHSTPTAPTFQERTIPSFPPVTPEQAFEDTLASLLPSTSPFPIVKRLLVVPDQIPKTPSSPRKQASPSESSSGGTTGKDHGEVKYAPLEGVENWMTRLLGEVVGDLLGELGVITLSSTLLPNLTASNPLTGLNGFSGPGDYPSRSSTSTPTLVPPKSSMDGAPGGLGISLTRAVTPGGRPTSIQAPSLPPIPTNLAPAAPQPVSASSNPFRRSSAVPSPFSRTSSAASSGSLPSSTPTPINGASVLKYTSADLTGIAGGRLLKLLGDFYLLSGMYGDAIQCYDDGAERCRAVGDVLWEGFTREGRAVAGIGEAWEGRDGSNLTQPFPTSPIPVEIQSHFMSALACIARAPIPYPPTIASPSPQAVSGSFSIPSSTPTDPSEVGTGEGLLSLLYAGLALKISHFVLLIWASGGWGSIALSYLVTHTLPRSFPPPLTQQPTITSTSRRKHARDLLLLSSQSQISRQSIFAHAETALGPYHKAMTMLERLAVNEEAVWLARWLGLERKEAGVTREVVKLLAGVVVENRQEMNSRALAPSPRTSMVSGAQESASLGLGLGMPVKSQAVAVRRKESTEGNAGIVALFERAAGIMGINLLPSFPSSALPHRSILGIQDTDDEEHFKRRFGWPELQVEMIKEGIAVMESLPSHPAIVKLCLTALNDLSDSLNSQSQAILAKMYPAALAIVRRRGLETGVVPWWVPGKIVMSLEIAGLSHDKTPMQHSRDEIQVESGKKDPFFYNPRTRASNSGKITLIANEAVDVFVTLRNPFAFNLDINELSIITSGAPFNTSSIPISIPALSVHTIRLSGIAPSAGLLRIQGVSVRLTDGSSTQVFLPVIDDKDKERRQKRHSRLKRESQKIKRTGMGARLSIGHRASFKEKEGEGQEKYLECTVVEELPLAWVKSTSLIHGMMMLYDGERSEIQIVLENSSSVPIDFVKLSMDDSTAREAQEIIAEGELTPEQAYELDWDQQMRPVFVWSNTQAPGEVFIPARGRATLTVKCLGKVGCSDGLINIDYGYVNTRDKTVSPNNDADSAPVSNSFYTRRISFPVMFTIYHAIECHSLDLTYLGGSEISSQSSKDASLYEVVSAENDTDHCLLGLSFSNVYGVPFEVTLARKGEKAEAKCTRLIPPGATERLILSLPRRLLDQEALSQPIPSLSNRQYIVEKEKKTSGRIAIERERFWYREALLGMLEATWTEPGSLRHGSLSLRHHSLSPSLLQILRSDTVDVRVRVRGTKDKLSAMDFVELEVEVVNGTGKSLSRSPFHPYIHLEPLPSSPLDYSWTSPASSNRAPPPGQLSHPHKNVLFDGLSSSTLPKLENGANGTFVVGATFLAGGSYSFRAAVEMIDLGKTGEEGVEGGFESGKKIWLSPLLHLNVV